MPRRASQHEYKRFMKASSRAAGKITERLIAGKIDAKQFADDYLLFLEGRHTRAGYIGRRRGGDLSPLDEDDKTFGSLIADEQAEFLDAFVSDLEAGKYRLASGELDTGRIHWRAQLYVKRLGGTANEAFVATAQADDLIEWHTTANESCRDCIAYEAGSPYKPDDLDTFPGAGATECITNCKCYIVRDSDNLKAFDVVDI